MKTLRFLVLIFGLLATTVICHAQITEPGWYAAQGGVIAPSDGQLGIEDGLQQTNQTEFHSLALQQPSAPVAEAITPEIQVLANSLQNNWQNIMQYVQSHIRYIHYYGSKKGAALTLLEKSGNDFDQCALLVALLRAAGYSGVNYQFGWEGIPYADSSGQNNDLRHWLNLSLSNTNWLNTSNYVYRLFANRGYPALYTTGDTNTFVFQRVWVTFAVDSTTYWVDPAFKKSAPVVGIVLTNAMGFASNSLMSAAAGTDAGNYVININEVNLRGTLTGYATNLLNTLQSNYPNASVEDIAGGRAIIPEFNYDALPTSLGITVFPPFNVYTISAAGATNGTVNLTYIPTNLMSSLMISFAGTNWQCWMPQLQGQRLSLTFSNDGLAQLWLDDSNLVQRSTSGSSGTTNVVISINHPFGSWNLATTNVIDNGFSDQIATNAYQRTNAMYALIYAFEPDWDWLRARQRRLDTYRSQGLADDSRQVVSETLNIMGLNWMLQTAKAEEMLAVQDGILPQYHHRFGRMAQEIGKGYYVDVYMQFTGMNSAAGADAANTDLENRHFDLISYLGSALENGIIEQLQSSNLVASSTVKMLQIANTNGQAVYLASSTNWSAISGSLANYDTTALYNNYISKGYYLLLPQNGANNVAGTGSWKGYGIAARRLTSTNENMQMLISGGYNGGYAAYATALINPSYLNLTSLSQPLYFSIANAFIPTASFTIADPVDLANGTFQVEHTDLSLGQAEPRGITLSRFYNGTRRYSNPAGMAPGWVHNYYITANAIAAPESGLGETTPAQAAAMMVATRAALEIYSGNPNPKNWLVAALIAKWGVDQLAKNAVSVTLGKDTVQFIKQPNGVFTPPANCTMTLLQTNGAYWLQQRRGNTFMFNASGLLTNIVDPYGQFLTVTNNASNWVSKVTDWKGRSLTFNYMGSKLASVSDGTRTIGYGYTGNDLTSFTNADGKVCSYLYDTNHQITATFNEAAQLVVSNVYDTGGHVMTQYTQGDTNKTWRIYWTGAQNIEQDPAGGQRVFTYDDKARLTSVKDALGKTTAISYDGQNHIIQTVSPLNETNRYLYDANNNVTNAIDALGYTSQFIYDNLFNLVRTIDARGNARTFGYNGQFSLTGQTNGAGDWVNYVYDTTYGTLSSRTDAGGQTAYTYDGTYRQLSGITYPNNDSESFMTSAQGDVTSHTDGNGNVTTFSYNNCRQLTNTVAPTNLITKAVYDNVGNVFSVTDRRGNVSSNTWSATRLLLKTTFPTTPQGVPAVSNVYDNRDWLVKTLDAMQQPTLYTNDAAGRMISTTDPLNRTMKFGYDAAGRKTATTNATGEKTLQQWSKRGELTNTIDNANHTIKRKYDATGNQTNLVNRNSKTWQFQYDGANRLTNTVSPLGKQMSQSYNNRGLLASSKAPSGQTATFGYDTKGRLTNRTDNVGTTLYKYDANDNLTNVTEGASSLSKTYDAYNRVSSFKDVYGNIIQYRYDANGNLTNLIYPGSKNVYYAFDSNNHLTNVLDWSGRKTSIAYDLNGHITSIVRPNGTQRTISYDVAGQVTNILEATTLGFPLALFRHSWNSNSTMQWEFGAPLPHNVTVPTRTMTYYDDNSLKTVNGVNVTNDADGNLIWGPVTNSMSTNYVYDARNRLLNAGGVTNAYDAMNNRVGQTQGTNTTIFVLNPNAKLPQVLMRIKNGVTNYYIYGAGLLYQITETATATNTLTYHYDYRGSTVALTDNNGNVTDRIEYSLYGSITYRIGTNDVFFLFNGRYGVQTDPNGLQYMQARYYNPYLCRFLTPDPSGFSGGINFYAYANGNPVNYHDPRGLSARATGDSFQSWLSQSSSTLLWGAYVFDKSADVRLNFYDPNVRSLAPDDVSGRIELKLDARAMTPQPIRGYLDATYPDLGPKPGSIGSANAPNVGANQTAIIFSRIGNGLAVAGAGIEIYNVATAPQGQTLQTVAGASGRTIGGISGGIAGAEIGAEIGLVGGPWGAVIGAAIGGIGGSLGVGWAGGEAAENLYLNTTPPEGRR